MPDDLTFEVGGNLDGLIAQLDKGGGAMDRFKGHAEKTEKSSGNFFGGLLGGAAKIGLMASPVGMLGGVIGDLGGALMDANKAADEEQVGMNRLYTTMTANIKGWDGNTDSVEAYISKQQELAFGDDQLRDSLNILVGQTHDMTEAQGLQTTAMDLARAKNIDLQTASKLVGKVDMDNLAALKKLGIEVTDHMTKEQALAAIRQQTAGQAEAYANTTEGAMTRLQTNMGNVVESIGHTILPKITEGLGGVADFVASPAFQGIIETGIGFVTTAFDNLGKIIEFVTPYVQPLVQAFQQFIAGIQAGGDPMQMFGTLLGNVGGYLADLGGKVLTAVGDALPGILAKLGEWGQAFLNWIGPMIPPMLAKLGELAGQLWGWLTGTVLPTIITKLGEWGKAFIDWVGPQIPPLLAKLGELAGQLWTWLTGTALPTIINKLAEWGKAFVDWIGPKIPPLLAEMGKLANQLGMWLMQTALPAIVTKLGEWGKALVDWVGPKILPLLGELGGLLLKVGGWIITEALPAIIGKLVEWGGAFLGFVAKDVLPKLPGVLEAIWTGITTWVAGILPKLGAAVAGIGGGLIAGIQSGITNAWNGLVTFLSNKVKDALPQFLKDWLGIASPSTVTAEMGDYLAQGFGKGFKQGESGMLNDFKDVLLLMKLEVVRWLDPESDGSVAVVFRDGFNKLFQFIQSAWLPQMLEQFKSNFPKWITLFNDTGMALGNGMAEGLVSAMPAIVAAAQAAVDAAIAAARARGDIHSPSGVAANMIGLPIGQGVAWGIRQSQNMVDGAMGNLIDSTFTSARGKIGNANTVGAPVISGGGSRFGGGHGGSGANGENLTVVVMMPDGSVLSQVVRGRQDSRQARPSVVLGTIAV